MDVETAFLNGKVVFEVYVKQPLVMKMVVIRSINYWRRCMVWEREPTFLVCFNNYITKLDFQRCEHDYCLYVKRKNSEVVFILLFVDDLLICCKDKRKNSDFKVKLSKKFNMKDLGKVKTYIGINIEYNYLDLNEITLS